MSQFYVTDRELINKLVTRKLDIPQSFALGWQCSITISFQSTFFYYFFQRHGPTNTKELSSVWPSTSGVIKERILPADLWQNWSQEWHKYL